MNNYDLVDEMVEFDAMAFENAMRETIEAEARKVDELVEAE